MLGHWKNFDELESSISIQEMMALLEFSWKKDYENKKFLAAINGVDTEDGEEINRTSDILLNQGQIAQDEGFGVGEGLGYMQLEE